jgi:hypothetical protein
MFLPPSPPSLLNKPKTDWCRENRGCNYGSPITHSMGSTCS